MSFQSALFQSAQIIHLSDEYFQKEANHKIRYQRKKTSKDAYESAI